MRSHQSQELLDDLVEAGQLNLEIFKLPLRNEDERGVDEISRPSSGIARYNVSR